MEVCHVKYHDSYYNVELFRRFGVLFPPELSSSVPKRCSEFLAGRYSARQALRQLTNQYHFVGRRKDRSPIWPCTTIGSISHSDTNAIAIVAYRHDYTYIGVDIEEWLSISTTGEIANMVLTGNELNLSKSVPLQFYEFVTLVFSVKESVYKALYPMIQKYFGFECVSVHSIDIENNRCIATLNKGLSNDFCKGDGFIVNFYLGHKYVVSWLVG